MTTLLSTWALLGAATLLTPDLHLAYERYRLDNGLEVILHEDHALPLVAVSVWYHAGPLHEAPGRSGFAHLFEHLMFQGSAHVSDDQHFRLLEAAGASMVNGSTDFDRTNYIETLPANQLALALWLESDRMGFLTDALTQVKLDNQRDVVMNERRQSVENTPYGRSDEKVMQLLYPPEHPYYGNVIGSMADLQAATLDDVRNFFAANYAPANATLVLAGDFAFTQARALIAHYFGTLPARTPPTPRPLSTAPLTEERRETVVEPVSLPRITLAWHSPAAFQPGDAEADLLAYVLGHGRASRLHKRLVYELEVAQHVGAQQQSQTLGSVFRIEVLGRPGVDVTRLERETQTVLAELQSTPPTDVELSRARNQLLTQMLTAVQHLGDFDGRAEMLNRYNQYLAEPDWLSQDLARYQAVTPDALTDFARTTLTPRRVVVITEPQP